DRLTLRQITAERQRLVDLVRSRTITVEEMRGGTFTISNLGMFPVDSFTALIHPPQAAILSVGRIQQVATPADRGGVGFRPRMTFGLTLDHRVADGAVGAAFLKDFIARVESPDLMANFNLEAT
ncbi:MAG: 2-oxo acid dehydrogenase subunit E2, partial [Pirellulales bacterium]|nr:2-oxo acid dehydrogenase subunit E2 [Pirellulales bacterium]